MNENMDTKVEKLRPFTRFCMTIGELPTSYLMSMTYLEQVLWFTKYLQETVIPAINNNATAVEEIQNFLKTLDLQDEVNNKLDEMAESGELEEIMASYLNSRAIFCFDNVAGMKDATNLINGSYAETLGYYSKNDGGKALYKIRELTIADVVDNGSIIALSNDNLIAELIPDNYISIYQFGAKGDGESDDSTPIQNAINYSINHNFIEVIGDITRTSGITKTIKLHAYNKVHDLNLDVLLNSLTNNYMISVNSTNVSTWDIEYPNATKGYLENVSLSNSSEISGINGILNAGNNEFKNIKSDKLNITFKSISSYLDIVQLYKFEVSRKIGTDYAIQLGSLGDACKLDTAHMYGTIGTANFITGFYGHNAITLKNLICNGNLYINGGNVTVENIHSESGQITITDAIANISNGYFYHNDPNITITNSFAKLNQLEFAYLSTKYDYTSSDDIDIYITNSSVEINDCYKTIKSTDINEKITSYVKTNLDSEPTINSNKRYYKTTMRNLNDVQCSFENDTRSVEYPQLSEKVKWRLPTGTYYYKAIPMVDFGRRLRTYLYDNSTSLELTNNDKGFRFAAADGGKWRLYRGTTDGSYDSYVDIALTGGSSIQDDGVMCNGYKWKSRTAGAIDSFDITSNAFVEYVKDNIRCFRNNYPTYGTWKKGDIIYKSPYTEAGPIGWICVTAGSPGTWVAMQ